MLVLAWLGSLAWLVVREYRPVLDEVGGAPVVRRLAPTASFSSLWAGPVQVGLSSITTDTLPDGIRVTSRIDVDVPMPLVPTRLLATTEALYDPGFGLRSFTTTASGEAGQVTLAGSAVNDTLLLMIISGRGLTSADTMEVMVPAGSVLPDAVPLALATRGQLTLGARGTVPVLDPIELTVSERRYTINAESTFVMADSAAIDSVTGDWVPMGQDTLEALLLTWNEQGLPVRAWVDRRGGVLEQDTPLGLTQLRAPFEIVNSGYARRQPRNVQAAPLELSIPVTATVPARRLSLGPVDFRAAAPFLATPWQTVARGELLEPGGSAIRTRAPTPLPDSVTSPSVEIPPSARLIVEARRLAGADTADQAQIVRALATWISATIAAGQPALTGVERALVRRRGDSSDRAALLVAMARSLGVPARPVAGLLASGGRLRYRAWAEVWLGAWVPVDPTLGQFPADAGHFRLLINTTARPASIVTMVGAVRPAFITPATTP